MLDAKAMASERRGAQQPEGFARRTDIDDDRGSATEPPPLLDVAKQKFLRRVAGAVPASLHSARISKNE